MSFKAKNINADPITGEPGSHPIGTSVGTASGATAGVIIGAAAGPIGSVAGAVVGAIAGGIAGAYAGKEIAEAVNPTDEDAYWRAEYPNRPYADLDTPYESVQPAYRYGYDARVQHPERAFEEVEPKLSEDWKNARGSSNLEWNRARDAVRDSFDRTGNEYKRKLGNNNESGGSSETSSANNNNNANAQNIRKS